MITSLEKSLLGARYLSALNTHGYDFELCQDFQEVERLAKVAGRTFQMPTFDLNRVDHTQGHVAWFFLKKDEERVGTMASIYQPIRTETLSSFLRRSYDRQFPTKSGATLMKVSPLLDRINGNLIYVGELHIQPKHRGNRTVLSSFMRLALYLCHLEWQPDWIYAFIPERHMRARLDLVYGFARSYPRALLWAEPEPVKRSSSEWFVAADRDELSSILSQGPG